MSFMSSSIFIAIVIFLMLALIISASSKKGSTKNEILFVGGVEDDPYIEKRLSKHLEKILTGSSREKYTRVCVCIKKTPSKSQKYQLILRIIEGRKQFFLYKNTACNKKMVIELLENELKKFPNKRSFSHMPQKCTSCIKEECPIGLLDRFKQLV